MKPANIDLQIDELIINGLPHLNGEQLGAVVQQALARMLAEQGVPPGLQQSGEIAALDAATITAPPNAPVETVGNQIALAVYEGFGL